MNLRSKVGESSYTSAVRDLIFLIEQRQQTSVSLFQHAEQYFQQQDKEDLQLRAERQALLAEVCSRVVRLSEGANAQDTLNASARLLGTLLLMAPPAGMSVQKWHQCKKPVYKAVLAARLLDSLLQSGQQVHSYVNKYYQAAKRYSEEPSEMTEFQTMVLFPIMAAAIYQDVGLLHPDAKKILTGDDGNLSEFRLLEAAERNELLELNRTYSLDFLTYGLGTETYAGDCKDQQQEFNQQQHQRLRFALRVMESSIEPRNGIGNLVKVPQVYTSVVLSTKLDYELEDIPKVTLLLEKVAETGLINANTVQALLKITGYFPQGFGVVYMPVAGKTAAHQKYEYAIVNGLQPADPMTPKCRMVSRNMTFNSFGDDAIISKDNNLYFAKARKHFSVTDSAKMQEIMANLYSSEVREQIDLCPKFWDPSGYFTERGYQNLWNKAKLVEN